MSTTIDVEAELEEAAQDLRALKAELSDLPNQLSAAARAADGAQLLTLRRRRDEIDALLFTARARSLRLEIQVAEQRRAELRRELAAKEEQLRAAAAEVRAAADELKRKTAAHTQISFEVLRVENSAEIQRQQANELRQQLAALIREASGEAAGAEVAQIGLRTGRAVTRGGDA
jgi:chromosome segregation ATPase